MRARLLAEGGGGPMADGAQPDRRVLGKWELMRRTNDMISRSKRQRSEEEQRDDGIGEPQVNSGGGRARRRAEDPIPDPDFFAD